MKPKIVLTNGCFDLLHPGHLTFLQEARGLGSLLVVSINSDQSVKRLKGEGRPIIGQSYRAMVLCSIRYVDSVHIMNADTVAEEIRQTKPDIWVKGGQWTLETLDESEKEAAREVGAEIKILTPKNMFSTSRIIDQIKRL